MPFGRTVIPEKVCLCNWCCNPPSNFKKQTFGIRLSHSQNLCHFQQLYPVLSQKTAPELGAFFSFLLPSQSSSFPYKLCKTTYFSMHPLPKLKTCWLQLGLKAKIVCAIFLPGLYLMYQLCDFTIQPQTPPPLRSSPPSVSISGSIFGRFCLFSTVFGRF